MVDEQQWRGGPGAHREAPTVELTPPAVDEPAVDEPAVDEPAVDEPAAGEPDVYEPVEDDLPAQLAAAAPRRWWSRTTVYLAGAALLVAGFLGGVQVQKSYGTPAASGTRNGTNFPSGSFQRGQGNQALPGGGAATRGGGTAGTIKLVDGNTVYVQTANGDVITIKTNGDTKVAVAKSGALKDLKAGDSVTVQGQTGSDGTVTATTVTATPK